MRSSSSRRAGTGFSATALGVSARPGLLAGAGAGAGAAGRAGWVGVTGADAAGRRGATLLGVAAPAVARASAICRTALNTCRQAPQRTAPWAAPSWARLTRKRVLHWGHWAT